MKIYQVRSSLPLSDVGIYLTDGQFSNDKGIVSLHPSKGTHWVAYVNEIHFDSYGCSLPQKLSKFIIKRNGQCLYSEYKIQSLTKKIDSYCASYCLYIIYLTKISGTDFKSSTNKTTRFTKRPFFYVMLGFTQSHSGPPGDIEGFIQLIPGTYKSDKPVNITGLAKIHLKGDCIQGSIVTGIVQANLYFFALSSPPRRKIYKEPRIKFLKKINLFCLLSHFI